MRKLYLLLCAIPVLLIVAIFMLIGKKHAEHPDVLSCTSFEAALMKSIKLHVGKSEFSQGIADICSCFKTNNPSGEAGGFVNKENLDKCAKPKIYEWMVAEINHADYSTENCVKDKVYERVVV